MNSMLETLHQILWGPWTLVLFLLVGLWFTISSGAFQIRGIRRWMNETIGTFWRGEEQLPKGENKNHITPFQTACTALAATIGTGNIVGVATALTAGGPGALFWMWISALIGMITAYVETALGQQYRYRGPDGRWVCGPMIYMERGLGLPWLGILYAVLVVLSSMGMGSMVQSNAISGTLSYCAGLPAWFCGFLVTILAAAVILGGIRRIATVSERLIPFSAGVYILFSLAVILSCYEILPAVFKMVFRQAFSFRSATGGIAGFAMTRCLRYGLSRGVFSNEAGLGSLAVLHGAAEQTSPEEQGMWAIFEVFFDTIVVCTMTALVILCITYTAGTPEHYDGAALTAWCFSQRIGQVGEWLVSAAMTVFAFATIIAWYYLGKQTAEYLLVKVCSRIGLRKQMIYLYTGVYLAAVFAGCICRLEVVWQISDIWNGLMAFPNLFALLLLEKQVRYPHIKKST